MLENLTVSDLITALVMVAGCVGVWVQLNGRIVKLEVQVQHNDRQFDAIMSHLRRIEEKLDSKADRNERN